MFINSIRETKYDLFAYIIVVTLVMIFLLPALIYLIILFIVNICKPLRFPGTQRCNIDIIKYIYIYI
jgi:hypothetical protein